MFFLRSKHPKIPTGNLLRDLLRKAMGYAINNTQEIHLWAIAIPLAEERNDYVNSANSVEWY